MRTLYVSEPGAVIVRTGKYLRIEQEGRCLTRISPKAVRQVFAFGDVLITPPALRALAQEGVPVAILSRAGKYVARIVPQLGGSPSVRRAQYRCCEDQTLSLELARTVVQAKLLGARQLLLRRHRNDRTLPLDQALVTLKFLREQAGAASSLKLLRGLEGRGGAVYFQCFPLLLRAPAVFPGRKRRPPPDPVNALLSLGYTLLRIEVQGQLQAFGLDPQVGFFHVRRSGRPALALDVMEEFRVPIVDRLVLRCFNLRRLKAEDFEVREDGGCYLRAEPRRWFFREYERMMLKPYVSPSKQRLSMRRLLHLQARELAQSFREGRCYRPHQPRL